MNLRISPFSFKALQFNKKAQTRRKKPLPYPNSSRNTARDFSSVLKDVWNDM